MTRSVVLATLVLCACGEDPKIGDLHEVDGVTWEFPCPDEGEPAPAPTSQAFSARAAAEQPNWVGWNASGPGHITCGDAFPNEELSRRGYKEHFGCCYPFIGADSEVSRDVGYWFECQ